MSLLGIDVGTTGCKACAFTPEGTLIASAYREYDIMRPRPGWAELDTQAVLRDVKSAIAETAAQCRRDPVSALAVSSLGEAVVPVARDGTILGNSILNFDERGAEYVRRFADLCDNDRLYRINGNTLGNHYSLTKLLWIRDALPDVYERTFKFLHWGAFVGFMLGAAPVVDFSLANRTLLFDLDAGDWSPELASAAGIDRDKLPDTAPSGTAIGKVSVAAAGELGLPPGVTVVTGAHDQCANALGCGVVDAGCAMFGMGTYFCITPVFRARREPAEMIPRGLNTEHHAVPGCFVTFLYNHGGSLLKWYRETFAAREHAEAARTGEDLYAQLIREIPEDPSTVLVLPHFAPTGPPEFVSDSSGVLIGLRLETTRGDILKGILEGVVFYLRECLDAAESAGIRVSDFRAVGGGSKSDAWLQISADILGRPLTRPRLAEAGALGSAILAGAATGVFDSAVAGAEATVRVDRCFDPDASRHAAYTTRYEQYQRIWPLMKDYLRNVQQK